MLFRSLLPFGPTAVSTHQLTSPGLPLSPPGSTAWFYRLGLLPGSTAWVNFLVLPTGFTSWFYRLGQLPGSTSWFYFLVLQPSSTSWFYNLVPPPLPGSSTWNSLVLLVSLLYLVPEEGGVAPVCSQGSRALCGVPLSSAPLLGTAVDPGLIRPS